MEVTQITPDELKCQSDMIVILEALHFHVGSRPQGASYRYIFCLRESEKKIKPPQTEAFCPLFKLSLPWQF